MPGFGVGLSLVDTVADVRTHAGFDIPAVIVVALFDVGVGDFAVAVPVVAVDTRRHLVGERHFHGLSVEVVGVGLGAEHTEEGLGGFEVGVVTDFEILFVGQPFAAAADGTLARHIIDIAVVAALFPEHGESLTHESVVVYLGFDFRLDVLRFFLLTESDHGHENHKYDGGYCAEYDERRSSAPLAYEFALGAVGNFAEQRQHEQRKQIVKTHDETADGVGKTVGVFEKKRHDKVVSRPENHNYRKCEPDLKSLLVVEPERFEFRRGISSVARGHARFFSGSVGDDGCARTRVRRGTVECDCLFGNVQTVGAFVLSHISSFAATRPQAHRTMSIIHCARAECKERFSAGV